MTQMMTPNQVTFARIACGFAAVALFSFFGTSLAADLAGVALTIVAIALDGLDGYIARKRGLATPLGAQLDILGDRVIENLFFTFFAVSGLISLWVPVAFFARGAATDFLRGIAARAGRNGFGPNGMLQSFLGRALVASRFSRAAYAALKCICFCYLGLLVAASHANSAWLNTTSYARLLTAGQVLTACSVAICIVRAIPVLWEGRRFLPLARKSPATPRAAKSTLLAGAAR
jgi:CDP-diacylglycerol--glycerol-3-phosphate 3-phosphatidyltransferase